MYSFLIVDDESLARQGLAIQLERCNADHRVVSSGDPEEAFGILKQIHVDAIFLDIDLPGMSGFGFLDQLQRQQGNMPPVIFTTGHVEFALKAFEYPVLDYLLKPVSNEHLARAIKKLDFWYHQQSESPPQTSATLYPLSSSNNGMDNVVPIADDKKTLSLKNGSSWLQLPVSDIFWIEAAGDYMCIHTRQDNHIIRATLRYLEQQLREYRFVRINRSSLVNLNNVVSCKPSKNGSYEVMLRDQQALRVSRKYKMLMDEASESALHTNG